MDTCRLSLKIPTIRSTIEIVSHHATQHDVTATSNPIAAISNASQICTICNIHRSKYICPRCHVPYCSVSCYRNHDVTAKQTETDTTIIDKGANRGCTEEFYEHHVSQILQLEVKERSDMFLQQMIQDKRINKSQHDEFIRVFGDSSRTKINNIDGDDGIDGIENQLTSLPCNTDELIQLWSMIEELERVKKVTLNDSFDDAALLDQLLQQNGSVRLRNMVHTAIRELATNCPNIPNQTTNTTQSVTEWILEPWSPWWRTNLVPLDRYYDSECEDDNIIDEDCCSSTKAELSLDERMLSLPRFETMFRIGNSLDSSREDIMPQLQFNLIDILAATTYTLRLHCGLRNIQEQDIVVEAAMILSSTSLVLSKDARYTTLESVLLECCSIHHPINKLLLYDSSQQKTELKQQGTMSSRFIIEDVSLLYQNHRFILRTLFEASDIIKEAIKKIKLKSTNPRNNCESNKETDRGMRDSFRRIHKKLQFYLSWSIAVTNVSTKRKKIWPFHHFTSNIQQWIEDWDLPCTRSTPNEN
jgi:hypothetical protein